MLGAGVAFTGIGVIATGRWQGPDFVPLLLVVLAAFFWGIANVTAKRAGKVDMLSFIVWASLVPPLPLFLLSWMVEDHTAILAAITSPGPLALGAVAYLAWPTTLFGFGAWNFLMGKYSASVIAPFSLLVPVFGTASGVIVLGERLDRVAVLGGGLVLTGLVLNVLAARRRPTAAA
jgi:O-acetylserine/cysteine efflux transporter